MDIAGAEKKLRQAEFFLGWLEHMPKEMANALASLHGAYAEPLEFYFSACLSAAQSVYYILYETGGAGFKNLQKNWLPLQPRLHDSWVVGGYNRVVLNNCTRGSRGHESFGCILRCRVQSTQTS